MTERRTKRRYAHELYPHAAERETRALAAEVPYLYARAVGFELEGTGWMQAQRPREASNRVAHWAELTRTALLADALHQGLAGDEAWKWADVRIGDDMGWLYERATHYGVPCDDIKPYPCGPEPDQHQHLGESDSRGWRRVTYVEGKESECPECTEPDDSAVGDADGTLGHDARSDAVSKR